MSDVRRSTVIDGVLQSTSVSSLAKFDPTTEGGCPRKWYLDKVLGIKEPETGAQEVGTKVHGQIEHYLTTGEDVLGPIARSGKHFQPAPGPGLLVEWGLNDKPKPKATATDRGNWYPPSESLVQVGGVGVIGFVDTIDTRPVPGREDLAEVIDNKTTSKSMYIKTPDDLMGSIQMFGYGEFVRIRFPRVQFVRLAHIAMLTKGADPAQNPKTPWLSVADVQQRWYTRAAPLVEQMKVVAAQKTQDSVPVNPLTCEMYRGCHYKPVCSFYKSLSPVERMRMGLLNKAKQLAATKNGTLPAAPGLPAQAAAPAPAPPAPTFAVPPPPSFAAAPTAVATPAPAPVPAPVAIPPVSTAPTLSNTYTMAKDAKPGQLYTLSNGAMGYLMMQTGDGVSFMSTSGGPPLLVGPNDVINPAFVQAPAPVAVTPPAPATAPVAAPMPAAWAGVAPAPAVTAVTAVAAEAPAATTKRPGRPRKMPIVDGAPAAAPAAPQTPGYTVGLMPGSQTPIAVSVLPAATATPAPEATESFCLFINCVPNGTYTMLDSYVSKTVSGIEKQYGLADLRIAPNADHPVAYGKWKGVLAATVKDSLPASGGDYVLLTRGSEINEAIADALIGSASVVVRGI